MTTQLAEPPQKSPDSSTVSNEFRPSNPFATERKPWIGLRSRLPRSPKADLLSGVTVALALVPEAIAFAFVAGVDPLMGLYSAFFLGLLTAIFGGRPGMISGATGAMAVVVVALVATHGVTYLFPAVILCGILQIAIGLLRAGKLIRIVPHPVMLGFVNGLAIVIGLAQLGSFKTLGASGAMEFLPPMQLGLMIALILLTMAIIAFLPKLTRAVPSTLVAIVVVTLLSLGLNMVPTENGRMVATVKDMLTSGKQAAAVTQVAAETARERHQNASTMLRDAELTGAGVDLPETVVLDPHAMKEAVAALPAGDVAAAIASVDPASVSLKGGLPKPFFLDGAYRNLLPPMTLQTLWIILPFSLILCGVGLIESLMTLTLIDEITETRGRGNRECVGQGIANVVCGFFGGMGGCAMIGQSLINVKSGGKGRLSGITADSDGRLGRRDVHGGDWHLRMDDVEHLAQDSALGCVRDVFRRRLHRSNARLGDGGDSWRDHFRAGLRLEKIDAVDRQGSLQRVRQPDLPASWPLVFRFGGFVPQFVRPGQRPGRRGDRLGKRLHLRHLSDECQKLLGKAGDLVEANISEDPHYHVAPTNSAEPRSTHEQDRLWFIQCSAGAPVMRCRRRSPLVHRLPGT